MNVSLGPGILDEMIAHAKTHYPREACGVLASRPGEAGRFIPAENILSSETAYEMDPAFLASTFRSLRESGEVLIGIFHSHPRGPAEPSKTDLVRAFHPDVAHIIVSLAEPETPQVRG